jgi:type I restriction enzyme S subunit
LREESDCIVSPSYRIFKSKDENILSSEYLMMWFRRPEFDRYARFKSHGSAHEFFEWEQMRDVKLPIPSIAKQKEIVKEYNTIITRITLNNQLIQKLEETAQAIYKQWFIDFEFPDERGRPYKSNGGAFVESELGMIPNKWETGTLKGISTISTSKISTKKIDTKNYVSTENMLQNRGGIIEAVTVPLVASVTSFCADDVLISNIRPYFKKIWKATFHGGCSNDILCFKAIKNYSTSFLYYSLERDIFFDYVMAGSNGAKMPRGEKRWIMDFPIVKPSNTILTAFNSIQDPILCWIQSLNEEAKIHVSLSKLLLSKLATIENK